MQLFRKQPDFDFIAWRWYALAMSLLIIAGGAAALFSRGGLPLGIDFSGGTLIVIEFEEPVTEDRVREALVSVAGEKVVQQYGGTDANQVLVRLPQAGPEEGASLEAGAESVRAALEAGGVGNFQVVGQELVGPVIGQELRQRGIYAFVFAMAGILVYVGLRFRFSFGVGAIVAVAHDIMITVSLLMFFGYELSLNVVAAMLTITGYSVNDSIVVFDRARENLRRMRRDRFDRLINVSINQTLARTLITSGTTGFAVLALYVFGGEVLEGFAFTMLVGVISGTYSTIFVAATVAILITQGRSAGRGAPAAARPPQRQQQSRRQNRKMRVPDRKSA